MAMAMTMAVVVLLVLLVVLVLAVLVVLRINILRRTYLPDLPAPKPSFVILLYVRIVLYVRIIRTHVSYLPCGLVRSLKHLFVFVLIMRLLFSLCLCFAVIDINSR